MTEQGKEEENIGITIKNGSRCAVWIEGYNGYDPESNNGTKNNMIAYTEKHDRTWSDPNRPYKVEKNKSYALLVHVNGFRNAAKFPVYMVNHTTWREQGGNGDNYYFDTATWNKILVGPS